MEKKSYSSECETGVTICDHLVASNEFPQVRAAITMVIGTPSSAHTKYVIRVENDQSHWYVTRRYSEFRRFWQMLRKAEGRHSSTASKVPKMITRRLSSSGVATEAKMSSSKTRKKSIDQDTEGSAQTKSCEEQIGQESAASSVKRASSPPESAESCPSSCTSGFSSKAPAASLPTRRKSSGFLSSQYCEPNEFPRKHFFRSRDAEVVMERTVKLNAFLEDILSPIRAVSWSEVHSLLTDNKEAFTLIQRFLVLGNDQWEALPASSAAPSRQGRYHASACPSPGKNDSDSATPDMAWKWDSDTAGRGPKRASSYLCDINVCGKSARWTRQEGNRDPAAAPAACSAVVM